MCLQETVSHLLHRIKYLVRSNFFFLIFFFEKQPWSSYLNVLASLEAMGLGGERIQGRPHAYQEEFVENGPVQEEPNHWEESSPLESCTFQTLKD